MDIKERDHEREVIIEIVQNRNQWQVYEHGNGPMGYINSANFFTNQAYGLAKFPGKFCAKE